MTVMIAAWHPSENIMTSDELLEKVHNQESFLSYARALAQERREAERLEGDKPTAGPLKGEVGWRDSTISRFIESGLGHFESDGTVIESPTWKDLAMFLYYGKMYE